MMKGALNTLRQMCMQHPLVVLRKNGMSPMHI